MSSLLRGAAFQFAIHYILFFDDVEFQGVNLGLEQSTFSTSSHRLGWLLAWMNCSFHWHWLFIGRQLCNLPMMVAAQFEAVDELVRRLNQQNYIFFSILSWRRLELFPTCCKLEVAECSAPNMDALSWIARTWSVAIYRKCPQRLKLVAELHNGCYNFCICD